MQEIGPGDLLNHVWYATWTGHSAYLDARDLMLDRGLCVLEYSIGSSDASRNLWPSQLPGSERSEHPDPFLKWLEISGNRIVEPRPSCSCTMKYRVVAPQARYQQDWLTLYIGWSILTDGVSFTFTWQVIGVYPVQFTGGVHHKGCGAVWTASRLEMNATGHGKANKSPGGATCQLQRDEGHQQHRVRTAPSILVCTFSSVRGDRWTEFCQVLTSHSVPGSTVYLKHLFPTSVGQAPYVGSESVEAVSGRWQKVSDH